MPKGQNNSCPKENKQQECDEDECINVCEGGTILGFCAKFKDYRLKRRCESEQFQSKEHCKGFCRYYCGDGWEEL